MFSSCCGCSNKKSNKKALSDESNEANVENQADLDDKSNVEKRTDDCVEILLKDRETVTTEKKDVISQEPTSNDCEPLPVEGSVQIGMNMTRFLYEYSDGN